MTYNEVTQAIDSGKFIYWNHSGYKVIKDSIGQYLIHCTMNDTYVGLKSCFFRKMEFVPTFDCVEMFVEE